MSKKSASVFLKLFLFIYLLAVLGLQCCMQAFSSCSKWGLLSGYNAWASHCSGFTCCGAWTLEGMGFSSCGAWS